MAINGKYIDDVSSHKTVIFKHPQTMEASDFIGNKTAINYLLSDFESLKNENSELRQKLNNELKEIKKAQVENIKNEILPLLPAHETMLRRYFHGSMQSIIGSIILSFLIGAIIFISKYSINDLWSVLGDFFKSLSNK